MWAGEGETPTLGEGARLPGGGHGDWAWKKVQKVDRGDGLMGTPDGRDCRCPGGDVQEDQEGEDSLRQAMQGLECHPQQATGGQMPYGVL